jgi:hypothetical protein
MMFTEDHKALIVTTAVGAGLWTLVFGAFHAYIISVDWHVMLQGGDLSTVLHLRPFICLVAVGASLGCSAELIKLAGGAVRSEPLTMLGPMLVGPCIGLGQGILVGTEYWGFIQLGVPLQSETVRAFAGAVCGFIAIPPTIMLSIRIRRGRIL